MANLHTGQATPGSGPQIMTWNIDARLPKTRMTFDIDVMLVQYLLFRNGLRPGNHVSIEKKDIDGKWGPQMDTVAATFTKKSDVVKDAYIDTIPPGVEMTPIHHKIYKIRLMNNGFLLSKTGLKDLHGHSIDDLNGAIINMPDEPDMPKVLAAHLKLKRLAVFPDFDK